MLESKLFWILVCLGWCLGQIYLEGTTETQSRDQEQAAVLRTEVSFRHARECPLILLPVHVNGRGPYEFIVDTGAAQSVLTPELARGLGIVPTGTREGMGAGGKLRVDLGTVELLAIGTARREAMPVGITDELQRISTALGTRINGAIGYDFLKHFRVTIDYDRQRLHLEHAGAPYPSGVALGFQMPPRKPLVIVPVHVNGRGPFQFVVDTGASSSAISPELATSLSIPAAPSHGAGLGAGGTVKVSLAKLESLQVGNAASRSLAAIVLEMLAPLSQTVGTQLDGIVGYDYLRNFRVTVDYPRNQLVLEPSTSR